MMRRRKPPAQAPELSRQIRADREAREMAQEEVARALGISLSAYRNYERIREPRPARLREIARVLGLPEDHYLAKESHHTDVIESLEDLRKRQDELARMMNELLDRR